MRDLAKKLIVYDQCFENLKNTKLQHIAGNFGKVVKKKRKSAYGWELNESYFCNGNPQPSFSYKS